MNSNNEQYMLSLIPEQIENTIELNHLQNIIGQEEACKKLTFFVQSHNKKTPFPTMLFTGSQGLGKSYTALKTAKALNRQLIEINCSTIETDRDLIEGLLLKRVIGKKPKTIFFDESHILSSEVTTILLTLLNPNNENKNYLIYNGWKIEFDLSKINVIFATTDAHRIFKPLKNRCNEIYFSLYTNDELYNILEHYLPGISLKCSKKDIAEACRGRARDAFVLSTNIKRYCTMKGINILNEKGWEEIKNIFGIYPKGLNTQEIKLMRILSEYAPISCRNIAISMGINENNVNSELEVRLREVGLIGSSSKGRILTKEGIEYVKNL